MRALCWNGVNDLRVENVPDPTIVSPHDAIVKVRLSTACGADLYCIDGSIQNMQHGDVIGHEFMGEVVELGRDVHEVAPGDRVVVPSIICCGNCWYCQHGLWSLCDNTNPNAQLQEQTLGETTAGMYGCSHLFGGYAGCHAQYVRVPHADVNCFKIPEDVRDEQALFLSDAAPTGLMGAQYCNLHAGDTVAVWGAGGVGQMAMQCARLLGAQRVIAIDRVPERLLMARDKARAETIDIEDVDVVDKLKDMTGGRGPDSCIDAAGMQPHSLGLEYAYDRVKQAFKLNTERGEALRQAVAAVRKGGTLVLLGEYGVLAKAPIGMLLHKGLTLRAALQHGHAYVPQLLSYVQSGQLDPSFLITHHFSLEQAPRAYALFRARQDGIVRPVIAPNKP